MMLNNAAWWSPAVRALGAQAYVRRLEPGALIALGDPPRPYRVVECVERDPANWHPDDVAQWQRKGMPDLWYDRPFVATLQPLPTGKLRHVEIRPHHWASWFELLPEHYAVCAHCGCLAPCRSVAAERQAVAAMKEFEAVAATLPGCCWGCQEPITGRQAFITFDGPNVLLPTVDGAAFHLRRACEVKAARYEDVWVNADASRARSLLTLRCTGHLVVHHDGTAECFGAVDSTCPSGWARHNDVMACYMQTHGCGRECPREGHPGASRSVPRDVRNNPRLLGTVSA